MRIWITGFLAAALCAGAAFAGTIGTARGDYHH